MCVCVFLWMLLLKLVIFQGPEVSAARRGLHVQGVAAPGPGQGQPEVDFLSVIVLNI